MNNVEAKFILQGYRPNGADASDPTFEAAMAHAGRDPALRTWFQREQEFDAKVAAKLSLIAPPAGLRDAILAGGRVSESVRGGPERRWSTAWLAVAACLALLATLGVALWPNQGSASADFVRFVVADASELTPHGGHGEPAGALAVLLSQPSTKLGRSLPVNLEALRVSGCRTVNFRGREVLEICFNRGETWFHCYIAPRAALGALVGDVELRIEDAGQASFAKWADANLVYVVVSHSGRAALQTLL
jgi:hypothetical protein